ncbi:heterokaryon incompatibility protein-domain-containing protein, partial [Halenospora varia]
IRILQEKLSHCDKYHTESCHGVAGRERPCPVYFIDTKQLCIVPSTTGSKYVALSYVWGETTQILLTQENASALMQPGGLRQIWHSISRVIREAIQLVSEVDIYENRYLWVDSLCILSNDKEHKHSQINQMDAIYGQSALTIIALAADDASSSLFCSNDTDSGSDRALREVERLKNVEFIPDFRVSGKVVQEADRRGYVYRTRGWTFQEEQLSRRRLYWTQSGFVFRC